MSVKQSIYFVDLETEKENILHIYKSMADDLYYLEVVIEKTILETCIGRKETADILIELIKKGEND